MKRILIFKAGLIFLVLVLRPLARAQEMDPVILSVRDAVSADTLMRFAQQLSGEIPVYWGEDTLTIASRNINHPGNELAAQVIAGLLAGWGHRVEEQTFKNTGKNIIGIQDGALYPSQVYILCAHYDSMPDSSVSPGADDNVSGTVAVLEAARVLSEYSLNFTVKYCFWDEEEYGYYGSEAYVAWADSTGEDIRGVVNLDMIAWDADGDSRIILDVSKESNLDEDELWSTLTIMNARYGFRLDAAPTFEVVRSDQRSFRKSGYAAIGLHEDFFGDMNAYYHLTDDIVDHFNADYFHRCSQLAICSVAELANSALWVSVAGDPGLPTQYCLAQNYPNPFNPQTRIVFELSDAADVSLRVHDQRGRLVKMLMNEWKTPGQYSVDFHADELPSGVYTYTIQTSGFTESKKMLLLR